MLLESLTREIIGCALEVHRGTGPGLLESAYHQLFAHELALKGLSFKREVHIPLLYKATLLESSYRADLIVEDMILIELKAIETVTQLHRAQTLTNLKLARLPVGLLINFNSIQLRNGIKRFINTT